MTGAGFIATRRLVTVLDFLLPKVGTDPLLNHGHNHYVSDTSLNIRYTY